jgi:hypothetical protein
MSNPIEPLASWPQRSYGCQYGVGGSELRGGGSVDFIVGDVVVDVAGNTPALVTEVHESIMEFDEGVEVLYFYTILDSAGGYDYVREHWLERHPNTFVAQVFKAMVEELYLGKE